MTNCFTLESKFPRTSMQREFSDWTRNFQKRKQKPQDKYQSWHDAWVRESPRFNDIFEEMAAKLNATNFTCGEYCVPNRFVGGRIPEIKYSMESTQRIEFCGRQHEPKFASLFPRLNIKGRPKESSRGAIPGMGPAPFSATRVTTTSVFQ